MDALATYANTYEGGVGGLAAKVGVTPDYMYKLIRGERRASDKLKIAIQAATEGAIKFTDWYADQSIEAPNGD